MPVQKGPDVHTASCTMSGGSLLGVKRPGSGVVHPPTSNAKFENGLNVFLRLPFVGAQTCLGVTFGFFSGIQD